jgi:hypothetical protein
VGKKWVTLHLGLLDRCKRAREGVGNKFTPFTRFNTPGGI